MGKSEKAIYNGSDVYYVCAVDGKKYVKVNGYLWRVDYDEEKPWRAIEFRWFFIEAGLGMEEFTKRYDLLFDGCAQDIYDFSDDEVDGYVAQFAGAKPLGMASVGQDTPEGLYVDC